MSGFVEVAGADRPIPWWVWLVAVVFVAAVLVLMGKPRG